MPYLPPLREPVRTIGRRGFDFDREIVVMGGRQPDPGLLLRQGRTYALDRAVEAALAPPGRAPPGWTSAGCRSRPIRPEVSAAEELDRVLPVVAAVAMGSDVVISVDTFRPEVADACLAAGAAVVNDTTGLRDPELAAVVAARGATIVITHSLAAPRQHLRRPEYGDVVEGGAGVPGRAGRVRAWARASARADRPRSRTRPEQEHPPQPGPDPAAARDRRPRAARCWRRCPTRTSSARRTGLAKRDRTPPSLAAATVCALAGARILRMHDVAAAVAAARMTEVLLGLREPAELRHNLD